MEQVTKKVKQCKTIRWFAIIPGFLMYILTQGSFGQIPATVLGLAAVLGFYIIFDNESKRVICEHVAEDLHNALEESAGHQDCIFEIKNMKIGMIIRVYLIKAAEKAPLCSKTIIEHIANSWYRPQVWITQIVDIDSEDEVIQAQKALNEELINDIKNTKDEMKK